MHGFMAGNRSSLTLQYSKYPMTGIYKAVTHIVQSGVNMFSVYNALRLGRLVTDWLVEYMTVT